MGVNPDRLSLGLMDPESGELLSKPIDHCRHFTAVERVVEVKPKGKKKKKPTRQKRKRCEPASEVVMDETLSVVSVTRPGKRTVKKFKL